jgi:hypothetical protein
MNGQTWKDVPEPHGMQHLQIFWTVVHHPSKQYDLAQKIQDEVIHTTHHLEVICGRLRQFERVF